MFSGLNKFIKNILPKRLFYRALLIVAVPVIVLQIIITFVFFDSLWIKTNKGMTKALTNEINTFIEVYKNEMYNKNEITNLFSLYQDLNIELIEDDKFIYKYDERWFSPIDRTLRRELKSRFGSGNFWFDTTDYKELILRIQNIINKTKNKDQKHVVEFENIKIDLNKQTILKKNVEFKINNTEKIILKKMINDPGKIFSREDIGAFIQLDKERSIDVIITRLRKKIEIDSKNPKFLQTIRGEGYVLWIE